MLIYGLSFLLGVVLFSRKITLEITALEWDLLLGGLGLFFTLFSRWRTQAVVLGFLLLGFVWMAGFSTWVLSSKVSEIYLNKPIKMMGNISSLVKRDDHRSQFIFTTQHPIKSKLRLSWYGKNRPELNTGESYQLLVKLKQNNGYQNHAGFDFEQYLFYQRIDASGYVRSSDTNQRLDTPAVFSLNSLRASIKQQLSATLSGLEFGGVINALILGDRSLIKDEHWQVFTQTNTTHLSVISGLHIGLISGLVFLLSSYLWRRCYYCLLRVPAQIIGAYFGLASATIYALIAGLSIPTQRALIMAGVVFISVILRRHQHKWQLYGLALLLVLLINPLSVFSAGFWLSFYVVGIIIYAIDRTQNRHWFYQLLYTQWLITLLSAPLVLWFFSATAWSAPIANLLAIPSFSFIITPLSLLAAALNISGLEAAAHTLFLFTNQVLDFLLQALTPLSELPRWQYRLNTEINLILMIGAIMLLLASNIRLRLTGLVLLIASMLTINDRPEPGQVRISILDVGQGLAVVVNTWQHALVFDTGAKYPSGFDLGESVVVPYLHAQGIKHLDKLIISHGDNDHIGGLESIQQAFSINNLLSSEPRQITNSQACHTQPSWVWDGVRFEMLNLAHHFSGNNASCVLKISTKQHSVLLGGDIERLAEKHLLATQDSRLPSDILLVPHHGSKTSSTLEFLTRVNPTIAIASSGFNNRFNHPNPMVVKRYQDLGIKLLNTACSGQIDIYLGEQMIANEYRKDNQRYYWRRC